jgi:hypothetical protein
MLGTATDAVGDPQSAAAFVSGRVSSPSASFSGEYGPQTEPDKAIELRGPGRGTHLVTAAELNALAGRRRRSGVSLSESRWEQAALGVAVNTPPGRKVPRQAVVVISRAGRILAHMPLPATTSIMQWSPDGQRIAFCRASPRAPSSVTVWSVGQGVRTIALPGRRDVGCKQLLWSPDGSQLIYAADATERGLTQADKLQHGWTVINLRSGRVHDVTAPGQPAAWLPSTAEESR